MFKKKFLGIFFVVSIVNAGELKRTDYKDKSIDSQKSPLAVSEGASLSQEDAQKMLLQIEEMKKKQAESQKALDELDRDE